MPFEEKASWEGKMRVLMGRLFERRWIACFALEEDRLSLGDEEWAHHRMINLQLGRRVKRRSPQAQSYLYRPFSSSQDVKPTLVTSYSDRSNTRWGSRTFREADARFGVRTALSENHGPRTPSYVVAITAGKIKEASCDPSASKH